MPRKFYIPLFVAMSASFVPVILHFGLSTYTVPAICIIYGFAHMLFRGDWILSLWTLAHLALYLGVFYAFGRLVFWLSTFPASQSSRSTIQLVALLALFACSFIRVITYDSIAGVGGTYTFWGAVSRFAHNKLQ